MSQLRSKGVQPAGRPVGVVIVDADATQRRTLAAMITERSDSRFSVRTFATPHEAESATGDIVIADIETMGGAPSLTRISETGRRLIAVSGNGSLSTAVAAMRSGASDFLAKPIGAKALLERLEAALKPVARPAAGAAPRVHENRTDFAGFIGRSPAMQAVYAQIRRIAPSRAPVFITGESGTGKELCAEAIHAFAGPSTDRPFIAINCSAIPRELMESEIFGHVRGAFTGASDNRAGAAELANGGTLFLDEVGEMDLGLQAKLLRFLQTGTFNRVGGNELKKVDVRIVCATNRDPEAQVAAGRFRADLFYRLHVLPIHLPPLRERGADIRGLAESYLARFSTEEGRSFAGFSDDAVSCLARYTWPGNVRELANVIRRIVVLDDGATVEAAMLPPAIGGEGSANVTGGTSVAVAPFWQEERRVIETAVAAFDGNIARAAAALEISPSTIYRKRQSWPALPG